MGCRDRDSNNVRYTYSNGQWWSTPGPLMSFAAPDKETLLAGIRRFSEEPPDWWVIKLDLQVGLWTAQQPADSKHR